MFPRNTRLGANFSACRTPARVAWRSVFISDEFFSSTSPWTPRSRGWHYAILHFAVSTGACFRWESKWWSAVRGVQVQQIRTIFGEVGRHRRTGPTVVVPFHSGGSDWDWALTEEDDSVPAVSFGCCGVGGWGKGCLEGVVAESGLVGRSANFSFTNSHDHDQRQLCGVHVQLDHDNGWIRNRCIFLLGCGRR